MERVLLMELEESWIFGMLWPKRLRIFEDRIEISTVVLLRETVETTEYAEVESVVVGGGGTSTSLLIRTGEARPTLMRGLDRDTARRAKALIEDLAGRATQNPRSQNPRAPNTTESLLHKLAELRDAGVLSPEEFEAKRRAVEGD